MRKEKVIRAEELERPGNSGEKPRGRVRVTAPDSQGRQSEGEEAACGFSPPPTLQSCQSAPSVIRMDQKVRGPRKCSTSGEEQKIALRTNKLFVLSDWQVIDLFLQ